MSARKRKGARFGDLSVRSERLAVFLTPRALRWLEELLARELEAGNAVRSVGAMASLVIESAAAASRRAK